MKYKIVSRTVEVIIPPPSLRVFCNSKAQDLLLQNVSRTTKTHSHLRHFEITPPSLRVFLSCKAKDLQLKNVSRTTKTHSHHHHFEYFVDVKPKIYYYKMYRELQNRINATITSSIL